VGGIDDQNTFSHEEIVLRHSNYGTASNEVPKPDLVAPSICSGTCAFQYSGRQGSTRFICSSRAEGCKRTPSHRRIETDLSQIAYREDLLTNALGLAAFLIAAVIHTMDVATSVFGVKLQSRRHTT